MVVRVRLLSLVLLASGAGNRNHQVHAISDAKQIALNSPPAQNVGRLCNVE